MLILMHQIASFPHKKESKKIAREGHCSPFPRSHPRGRSTFSPQPYTPSLPDEKKEKSAHKTSTGDPPAPLQAPGKACSAGCSCAALLQTTIDGGIWGKSENGREGRLQWKIPATPLLVYTEHFLFMYATAEYAFPFASFSNRIMASLRRPTA